MFTPPKPAQDLLAQFTDACLQRELPTDRLRVLWWELGGSDAGWFFDWQGWRPRSYRQEQTRRNESPVEIYRRAPDSILHVHERVLPAASCAWLVLTPDEAMSAGYEDRIDRSRGDDVLPRYIKVTLWVDEVYPVHVFEFRKLPAIPGAPGRAGAFIARTACGLKVPATPLLFSTCRAPATPHRSRSASRSSSSEGRTTEAIPWAMSEATAPASRPSWNNTSANLTRSPARVPAQRTSLTVSS